MNGLVLISILSLIISCGKSPQDPYEETYQENVKEADGYFKAYLMPVNEKFSGNIHGQAVISKFGDEFKVEIQLKGAPHVVYQQALRTGNTCPRLGMDLNGDGYIDIYEAKTSIGQILIPLDEDLSSQSLEYTNPLKGNYKYQQTTSYLLMLSDLHLPDEDLELQGKAIVISSASGKEIPVACGILVKGNGPDTEVNENTEEQQDQTPPPVPSDEETGPDAPEEPTSSSESSCCKSWWQRFKERWWRWYRNIADNEKNTLFTEIS